MQEILKNQFVYSLFRFTIVLVLVFIAYVTSCKGQASDSSIPVYFKRNSSVLNRESIRQLTQWLAENKPPVQLNLKGFTDTTGSSAYNRTLSMARAKSVGSFIKNFSEDYVFTTVQGLGEDSLPDRSLLWQNRKVVVEIVLNTNPFEPPKVGNADTTSSSTAKHIKVAEQFVNKALENIYFVPDKPVLEEVSLYYLKDLASALLRYPPNTTFEIVGHVHCLGKRCNDPGLKKINDELSTARAKEVYLHLADMGIFSKRLSYRGVGSENLQYPHAKTEEEARKNMRVEVIAHW